MTVADKSPFVSYLEDGVTTTFPVGYRYLDPTNLTPTRYFADGSTQLLQYGSDFTATPAPTDDGGTLTVTAAAAAGTILRIARDTVREQDSHYTTGDLFPASTIEGDFDQLMLIAQEIDGSYGDLNSRALQVPIGESVNPLPSAAARAGLFLSFDPLGQPTMIAGGDGGPSDDTLRHDLAQSNGSALVGYATSGAGALARTVQSKLQDTICILDFAGADPTGTTASNVAIAAAVAVAKVTGAAITFPAGNYKLDTSLGSLTLDYVTLIGSGVSCGQANPALAGSVFSIVGTTNAPFQVGPGVSFKGFGFYYPEQVDSATPIVFPPTININYSIAGAINFVVIEDCTVFNAYRFYVDANVSGAEGHCWIINNTIYGILTCIEIAYNPEIISIQGNEFTFGHFLVATEAGLRGYTRAHGAAINITNTDGLMIQENAFFGYQAAIQGNATTGQGNGGVFQLTTINDNYFDQCRFGITVGGNGNLNGITIIGNSFYGENANDTTVVCTPIAISTVGTVVDTELVCITGNSFNFSTGDDINITGGAVRNYTISGNQFRDWGFTSPGPVYGAINVNGAGTSIVATNNTFASGNTTRASGIIATLSTIIVSGSIFGYCYQPVNIKANVCISSSNQSYGTGGSYSNNYTYLSSTIELGNKWDKDATLVTGWGTPSGAVVINNFPGATATLLQTSGVLAEVLAILKARGMIGA
jgi:hypothetical protein